MGNSGSVASQKIVSRAGTASHVSTAVGAAKPVREAPAKYVATETRPIHKTAQEEFRKAQHTVVGINKTEDHVRANPQPWTEIGHDATGTPIMDKTPPKWYLNAFLDAQDSTRKYKYIGSGTMPLAWDRDKFEPYSLVKNRIDDEDLDWLLSENVRTQPPEALVDSTKLEKEALQDLLDYVELPRKQYRNFQGKLRKVIDDPNKFQSDRVDRIREAKEDDLLREIGYSDQEVADDRQYRTKRSRGVKMMDDLGISVRSKRRSDRMHQHDEMDKMLEKRKQEAIGSGTYQYDEKDFWADGKIGEGGVAERMTKSQATRIRTPEHFKFREWRNGRRRDISRVEDIGWGTSPDDYPDYEMALPGSSAKATKEYTMAADFAIKQNQSFKSRFESTAKDQELLANVDERGETIYLHEKGDYHPGFSQDEMSAMARVTKAKKEADDARIAAARRDIEGWNPEAAPGGQKELPKFFQSLQAPLRPPSQMREDERNTEFTALKEALKRQREGGLDSVGKSVSDDNGNGKATGASPGGDAPKNEEK